MMKAKCLWTDRDTCSFHWTRDELIAPSSDHKELSRSTADGRGETRCSPLFPLRTVAGGKARVETSVWFRDAEPAVFRVDVLSVGGVCWGNFEAAVWLEAANGVMLGKKTFVHKKNKFDFPIAEVRAFLSTASPPFVVCVDLRSPTSARDADASVRRMPLVGPVQRHPARRFKQLVPAHLLAKKGANWESEAIKVGAANAFTIRIASKPLPGGRFGISFWLKNASDGHNDGVWHVRRWLENKAGEKSFVWENAEIFFDGLNWSLFQWQGPRASLLKFSAASDMFLGVECSTSTSFSDMTLVDFD
ncbi:hypothetical protein M3Y99_01385700 [Aphelenchoides fujianensis]|nr:hypothetical protein M3Y99_01385700 [Aphelenchoides fujianensis]